LPTLSTTMAEQMPVPQSIGRVGRCPAVVGRHADQTVSEIPGYWR
jgi:hypothetical protein